MLRYVLKRLLLLIPMMFFVSILAFLLVRAMPGDAATAYLLAAGIPPSDEAVAAVTEQLGLSRPFLVQYLDWITDVLRFDFGYSYVNNKPVGAEIVGAFKNTLQMVALAYALILLTGLPMGILSALKPHGKIDHFSRIFSFIGASMPSFWLGYLLVQFFSLKLGWLPVSGMGDFKNLILPAFTLSVLYIAMYSRVLRNSLEYMGKRHVTYSQARGLSEKRILGAHVFRTSLIPVITTLGVNTGHMLAGTVIIEVIFSWPGIGRLIVSSITARDFPMIQEYIIFMALAFMLINLAADLACAALDPRIRTDRRATA